MTAGSSDRRQEHTLLSPVTCPLSLYTVIDNLTKHLGRGQKMVLFLPIVPNDVTMVVKQHVVGPIFA